MIVTSSDSPGDKGQAARLGATRYFQKPLDLVEFMKLGPLVREVLNSGSSAVRSTFWSRIFYGSHARGSVSP